MQEAAIRPASRLETVTSLAGQALRVREVRAIITRLRFAGIAAALGAASLTVSPFYPASVPGSAAGPITTPVSAVRFYQESVNRGLCAQAYKLVALGEPRTSMHPFLTRCAATKYLAVIRIIDPGYRLGRLSAQYTCLGVQLRTYLRNGAVQPSGGWYLMEKTPALFWHILLTRSHIIPGGKAAVPPRAICAGAIPSYARLSSAQLIIGSAFLSGTTAWIAVSRSGAYVPNGSCTHGIGSNCDTADTVIYRTDDAGVHWRRLLSLTTSPGPLVWIRLFTESDGLVAADMGAQGRGMLFRTSDEGRSWSRSPLPAGYSLDPTTITFPDSRHGWVYIGNGAMGSMAVTVFATADGGTRWTQVACTPIPAAPQPCRTKSGIPFSGDKGFISFINSRSGWLSIVPNSGIPALLHSIDGGHSWHDQHVGLPPTVRPSNTVFPMGVFGQPSIFGHVGIMAESVDVYRPRNRTTRSGLYVYRSADAGASWHFEPASSLPTAFVARNDPGQRLTAQVVDAQHWFATDDAVIWWTADGGRSWFHVPMHVPRGLDLVSLTFMDSVHGWAEALPHRQTGGVLGATALLRTRDGGRDWLRITRGA